MPTLTRLSNGKIAMYANDHGEPHFHVETPDGRCSVSIARLVVIVGDVDKLVLQQVLAWAKRESGNVAVTLEGTQSMKLPTIKSARALKPHRVEVIWSTGRIDKVDVGAALKAHASLAPALKKARFNKVAPGEWGHSLSWGGAQGREIEIGADAVWRMARAQSAEAESVDFTAWRAAHGLSLTEAAHSLGLSRRAVAYYESGAKPVPRVVALALKGFDAQAA